MIKKILATSLAENFAKAVQKKDIEQLTNLLYQKGEYQIQDKNYKFQDATRFEFLQWLKLELEMADINKIQYNQCSACAVGNSVVLFNDGKFAYVKGSPKDHDRVGMMLKVAEGKIVGIRFCGNFKKM